MQAKVEVKFNAMTNVRLSKIGQYIKAGRYFEMLGRTLEIAQREMETPTRRKKAGKLLARLRGDANFLQEH